MSNEAIKFNDVSLIYGTSTNQTKVLKGIDFNINSDEIVSIVGT